MYERRAAMKDPCFWVAILGSLVFNGLGVGFFILVCHLVPTSHALPIMLVGYGDSDVEGFPVDVVSLDPGTYKRGVEHTPGGDNAPLPPSGEALPPPSPPPPAATEPLKKEKPDPEPVVEKPEPKKDPAPEETPPPAPEPAKPAEATPSAAPAAPAATTADGRGTASGVALPGAAGGAQMRIGTPSAGGRLGSRTGVQMVDRTPPPYPPEARNRGMEGKTIVLVTISADGYVTEATVHESSGYAILDNAAIAYARTRRYLPARENNVPVVTTALHPVNFRLAAQ